MPKNKSTELSAFQQQGNAHSLHDFASSLCAHPKLQKWNLRVKPVIDDDKNAFMQHLKHIASKARKKA